MTLRLVLAAFLAAGCAGAVDLGQDTGEQREPPLEPEILALLPSEFVSADSLTVLDGWFFFRASHEEQDNAAYRCRVDACDATFARILPDIPVAGLSSNGKRLGFWTARTTLSPHAAIGSCLPPGCVDRQMALSGSSSDIDYADILFLDEAVYFFLLFDTTLYRCSLPRCEGGPRAVHSDPWAADLVSNGSSLFWRTSNQRIVRGASAIGAELEELWPDVELRAWKTNDPPGPEPSMPQMHRLAVNESSIFAQIYQPHDFGGPLTLVRWPATGFGLRETLVPRSPMDALYVFGDEVVWTTDWQAPFARSCHADACAGTQRDLGLTLPAPSITSDARQLYWLEPRPEGIAIRHVRRLDPD